MGKDIDLNVFGIGEDIVECEISRNCRMERGEGFLGWEDIF